MIEEICSYGNTAADQAGNILCYGDNIKFMKHIIEQDDMKGKVKMIYIDPPFFSKTNYDAVLHVGNHNIKHPAYDDKWQQGLYDYLRQLTARLVLMKKLLADDGLIWLHLDWHVVHYAKVVMDEIFGEKNFVNEIIWTYKSGGSSKKRFSRKHDNILVYAKSGKYKFNQLQEKSYNRQFKAYRFKGVSEYKDELGWYTMVNMKDVWSIDMVGRTSAERTGYATQKPEQLIERIIDSCTDEGDICADFFCGSGTLPTVAARKGRRFIACDSGGLAIECTIGRLCGENAAMQVFADDSVSIKESSNFEVNVDVSFEDIISSDKKLLKIKLDSVKERRLAKAMDGKSKDVVKSYAKKDPLSLIEAWSVDYDYDGKVHRPTDVFVRTKGKLESGCEKIVADSNEKLCIKIVDVMGNVTYYKQ